MLDKITYEKKGEKYEKTVVSKVDVEEIEKKNEIEALEQQIKDMKAGVSEKVEDLATIDAAIANYEEAIATLKS